MVVTFRDKEAKINEFLRFLNESWTAFHAVAEVRRMLINAGFEELIETERYESKLRPNGGYVWTATLNFYLRVGVTSRKCYLLLEYRNIYPYYLIIHAWSHPCACFTMEREILFDTKWVCIDCLCCWWQTCFRRKWRVYHYWCPYGQPLSKAQAHIQMREGRIPDVVCAGNEAAVLHH